MTANRNVRHPDTEAKPVYPLCHVFESRSGHTLVFDDTSKEAAEMTGDKDLPGKVQDNRVIRLSHALGSYMEINEQGRWTRMVQNNAHDYVKGGVTRTVEKGYDKRTSHYRKLIGSDHHNEVAGDVYYAHTGDVTQGGNNHTIGVKGDITLSSSGGDIVVTNKDNGGMTISTRELRISCSTGDLVMSVKGEMYQHVQGNMSTIVDGRYKIKARQLIFEGPNGIAVVGPPLSLTSGGYTG